MTPASNEHGLFQALIVQWLTKLGAEGHVISECSVLTSAGIKVADVAWAKKRSSSVIDWPIPTRKRRIS